MTQSVLLVEDDPDLREALIDTLELENIKVTYAEDGETAIVKLKETAFDLVISDVNMPGIDGHELLSYIKKHYCTLPVVLMTAYGQIEKAVEAMRFGAVDYLMKPFEPELLIQTVKKFSESYVEVDSKNTIAESTSSLQLLQLAKRVALTDTTVLITGESGTGKEVLARYIHTNSTRSNKPFVAINCAAIPENMLESLLFGHEKGAFTGAVTTNAGKFEQANGGTILLDEVTEMPLGLQAKLLRVLQEQEVERVGGKSIIPLDVRVLATTNRNLYEYVSEKQFREDLYYRLNVFPLEWLPLRDRIEDIVPLAEQILIKHGLKMSRGIVILSQCAKELLSSYHWPGNVRELDNVIQRALIMQGGQEILAVDLHLSTGPIDFSGNVSFSPVTSSNGKESATKIEGNLDTGLRQHEFQIIVDVLKETNGSRKDAALKLDISPRTLRYKLAKIRDAGIDLDSLLKRENS